MSHITKELIKSDIHKKIVRKLPEAFKIAEIESSRDGKMGMEVGNLREKILIGLLISEFGNKRIDTKIPTIEKEVDVRLDNYDLSIKTVTKNGSIKAIWTVDQESAQNFINNYKPNCDIMIIQIWWEKKINSFFVIPLETQQEIFNELGKENYLKMPKSGTNARGAEYNKNAIFKMLNHKETYKIEINWEKIDLDYNVYEKWVEFWNSTI